MTEIIGPDPVDSQAPIRSPKARDCTDDAARGGRPPRRSWTALLTLREVAGQQEAFGAMLEAFRRDHQQKTDQRLRRGG